jgi:two-component system, cell cycle response regulator DivK
MHLELKNITYAKIPIAAVTAYAMEGDREKLLSEGCTHYLSKPFSKKQILKLLDKVFTEKDKY